MKVNDTGRVVGGADFCQHCPMSSTSPSDLAITFRSIPRRLREAQGDTPAHLVQGPTASIGRHLATAAELLRTTDDPDVDRHSDRGDPRRRMGPGDAGSAPLDRPRTGQRAAQRRRGEPRNQRLTARPANPGAGSDRRHHSLQSSSGFTSVRCSTTRPSMASTSTRPRCRGGFSAEYTSTRHVGRLRSPRHTC